MPPSRFVTDSSLAFLARRLRFLGYDVVVHGGARLEELFEAAAREGRVVLTLSDRHPGRWRAVAAVHVPRADAAAAVRAIVAAHEPSGPPLSRCSVCNEAVRSRSSFEGVGEVPGRVLRSGRPLASCPGCGRWFWPGSHVDRVRQWLEAALGRPVELPQGPPGAAGQSG